MKNILIALSLVLCLAFASCSSSNGTQQDAPQNILMSAEWHEEDVHSGSGDVIGKCAYISIKKEELKNLTNENIVEFAENKVEGKGYNWVSIICDDGTGICFSAGSKLMPTYGTLSDDGSITSAAGYLMWTDEGYTYKEKE